MAILKIGVFPTVIERRINIEILRYRTVWKLGWDVMVEKMNCHFTGAQLERSVRDDTADSLKAAYFAPLRGMPFPAPMDIVEGRIVDRLRVMVADSGLNYRQLLRQRWPRMKAAAVNRRADALRKNLVNKSVDGFTICLIYEVIGQPVMPCDWFLSNKEKRDLAADLEIKPVIAQMELSL